VLLVFEREWRFAGDFDFYMHQLHGLVVPAGEVAAVQADLIGAGVNERHVERFVFVEVAGAAGSAVA
jgi:hypothetical protein